METKLSHSFCWYSADGVHDVVVLGVGLDLVVEDDLEPVVLHRLDDLVDDVASRAGPTSSPAVFLKPSLSASGPMSSCDAGPQQRPRERVELLDRERLEKFVDLHGGPFCITGGSGRTLEPPGPPGTKDRRGGGGEPSDRAGAAPALSGSRRWRERAVPSGPVAAAPRSPPRSGPSRRRAGSACPAGRRACRVRSGRRARRGRREQQQVGAAGEEPVGGQLHLLGRGQVDEAVAGGREGAAGAGGGPVCGGDEVQQRAGHA